MALYKIANVFVERDPLPETYGPFETTECPDESRLLRIIQSDEYEYIRTEETIASLQHMNINRTPAHPGAWIYKFNYGIGTMKVSDDYSYAEGYFQKNFVSYPERIRFLEPFSLLALQCRIIKEGNVILHAACVSIKDDAYAFSGPSGIGKSTRASIWVDTLNAEWISGDKPIVNPKNRFVYGAPWDGSDHIFKNVCKPLKAILKVKRSHETNLRKMSYQEKYQFLMEQSFIPMWDKALTVKALASIKQMIKNIPIYLVECDNTAASMEHVYEILSNI